MDEMAKQQSDSPDCGEAHADQEGRAKQSSWDIALAPALEHSGESSEEEDDGDDSKSFEPHLLISLLAGWHRVSRSESARVTTGGDSGSNSEAFNRQDDLGKLQGQEKSSPALPWGQASTGPRLPINRGDLRLN